MLFRFKLLFLIFLVITVHPYLFRNRKKLTSSNHLNAMHLNHRSTLDRVLVESTDIEYLIRDGIKQKNWEFVKQLLQNLNSTTLLSKRNIVYVISETCRKTDNHREILPLIRSIQTDLRFLEDDILPLVKSCINSPNHLQMIQIMIDYFHEKEVHFSPRVYTTLLKGYGKLRNEKMIDSIVDTCITRKVRPDSMFFNALLNGYFKCRSYYKAFKLMVQYIPEVNLLFPKAVKKYLYPPSSTVGSAMTKRVQYLEYPLSSVTLSGINTFLSGLKYLFSEKLVNIHQVLDFLNLISKNYEIINYDEITYNTLVDLASMTNDVSITETILAQVKASLGTEAYTSFLSLIGKQGNVEKAFATLDGMIQNKVSMNEYTLTSVITSLIQQNYLKQAKDILNPENVYQQYLLSNIASFKEQKRLKEELHSAYISGICQLGLQSIASSSSTSLRTVKDNEIHFPAQGVAYQLLLEAQLQLLTMEHLHLLPNIIALNSFCNFVFQLYQPPKFLEMLLFLQYYQKRGLQMDQYTYSILLTKLGKITYNQYAMILFDSISMKSNIDITTINSFIKSFDYCKEYADGIVFSYDYLLSASSTSSTTNVTLNRVSQALNAGAVTPNIRTFNSIVTLLEKYIVQEYHSSSKDVLLLPSSSPRKGATKSEEELQQQEIKDKEASFEKKENGFPSDSSYYSISKDQAILFEQYITNISSSQLLLNHLRATLNQTSQSSLSQLLKQLRLYDVPYRLSSSTSTENNDSIKVTSPRYSQSDPKLFIEKQTFNKILYDFYKQLRIINQIPLDYKIINKLNNLFALINRQQSVWLNSVSRFFIHDDIEDSHQIITSKTARFIFEDIVLQGFDPALISHIMSACEYSSRRIEQFQDQKYLEEFRSSRESYRIFLKHDWNRIDSGWRIL